MTTAQAKPQAVTPITHTPSRAVRPEPAQPLHPAQNLNRLEQEANQCVGADVYETGSTRVETEIADGTPDEDISDIPDEQPLPVPYLPSPASGTM